MPTKGTSRGKPARRRTIRTTDRRPTDPDTVTSGDSTRSPSPARGLAALAGLWAGDTSLDEDLAALYASRAVSAR